MAKVFCPTSSATCRSTRTGLSRPAGASTWITAMSLRGSTPTTRAGSVCCPWKVTVSDSASLTTWKLVTMCPASSHTKPEPDPAATSSAVPAR